MKVLISGATSMIGAALTNKMLLEGHEVIAIVRKRSKKIEALEWNERLTIIECDMVDYGVIDKLYKDRVDIVFTAAWNGTRGSDRNNKVLQEKNYEDNINLLHAAIRLGCKKYITAGSQAEYGPWFSFDKISESAETNPDTEYGKYKLKYYQYSKKYCRKHECALIEPRLFSIYGPNDYPGTLIISTLKKMIANEPCDLTECVQLWDYLYIDDAVSGLVKLMEQDVAEGVYNFGYGKAAPLKEYIEKMHLIVGSKSKLNYGAIPYATSRIAYVNPDVSKLRSVGWEPRISFEEGIRIILDNMKT